MCMKEKEKELLLATKNKLMKIKDGKYWIGFKCFEQNVCMNIYLYIAPALVLQKFFQL